MKQTKGRTRLVATLLAAALLAGCGGRSESPKQEEQQPQALSDLSPVTLRQAEYPAYPQRPNSEEDGWEAMSDYHDAVRALKGDWMGDENRQMLRDFAARSAPLALAGQEGENALYAPVSLWLALSMAARCADGNTRAQVLSALGVEDIDVLREKVPYLWRRLYVDDGASALILGNSVWLNSNLEGAYVPETLDALAEDFYASAYAVPMGQRDADEAVTAWIADQTRGLVGGDGPVVETEEDTLALLLSSLYYKASWEREFDEALTGKDVFTTADGTESRVDFMHRDTNDSFLRTENWQAASLELAEGEMTFVLPDEGVSPEELLQDPDFLNRLHHWESWSYGEIEWSVPKFDVESKLELKDALAALGITDLLDRNRSDLSALTTLPAFLDKATQLARVKADETGVEAAAVTILELKCGGMPVEPEEVCVMDLDRPFLFVLEMEGVPLLIGVVNRV